MGVSIIHNSNTVHNLRVSDLRVCVGAQACTPPSLHREGLKGGHPVADRWNEQSYCTIGLKVGSRVYRERRTDTLDKAYSITTSISVQVAVNRQDC